MDVKGDLSGIAMPGEEKPFITERHAKIKITLFGKGISCRADVSFPAGRSETKGNRI